MEEQYSIKDGRVEAVMWIVYKDGAVVIEKRPAHPTKATTCLPAGHVDLNRDKGEDYIEAAFIRESSEEFAEGKFKPTSWKYLKAIDFEETERDGRVTKLKLHYFVVTEWEGDVPEYTVEHNGKHADLEWFSISRYEELPQICDREVLSHLEKML
ncbi:NUDIX domain-containing protein [Candidatus Woesearchaeota archaeon]|nr:NUDIX domain-containing protein [Candidatus Woesearchaeota archaeon]